MEKKMNQLTFFNEEDKKFINLKEASLCATQYLNRKVNVSNILYLVQYGKIKKYSFNGNIFIDIYELKNYYDSFPGQKLWEKKSREKINWHLLLFNIKKQKEQSTYIEYIPIRGSLFLN